MHHAFRESSGHNKFLSDTCVWLKSLQSLSSRHLPRLWGYVFTMRLLLLLWEGLHKNSGIHVLFTKRLNQDCVENLISVIRCKVRHRFNPSAQHFRQALRSSLVDSLFARSAASNSIVYMDKFLPSLKSLNEQVSTHENMHTSDRPWQTTQLWTFWVTFRYE